MKIEEIRSKGEVELSSELQNLKKELFDLRFKSSSSQSLPDPSRIRAVRRTIARMNTVVRERKLAPAASGKPQGKRKPRRSVRAQTRGQR